VPVLRARTSLKRAALVLALTLWASPAAADGQTIGGACTTGADSAAVSLGGNNAWCNGTTWQYPAYQFGSSTATCNSTNAGRVQWTGNYLAACNGSAWVALGGSYSVATTASTGLSTWVNQGTATETDTSIGMLLADMTDASGGQDARHLCKTAPATPYSIIAQMGSRHRTDRIAQ
jgi:hypothetical protein